MPKQTCRGKIEAGPTMWAWDLTLVQAGGKARTTESHAGPCLQLWPRAAASHAGPCLRGGHAPQHCMRGLTCKVDMNSACALTGTRAPARACVSSGVAKMAVIVDAVVTMMLSPISPCSKHTHAHEITVTKTHKWTHTVTQHVSMCGHSAQKQVDARPHPALQEAHVRPRA